jgi:hypothetical protein
MGSSQFTLGFDGPGWAVERGSDWLAWRDERNAAVAPEAKATPRGAA